MSDRAWNESGRIVGVARAQTEWGMAWLRDEDFKADDIMDIVAGEL